ncbi:hypothetical protein ACWKSP_07030 [Micromonosporaceae bacterium Da 78-11]
MRVALAAACTLAALAAVVPLAVLAGSTVLGASTVFAASTVLVAFAGEAAASKIGPAASSARIARFIAAPPCRSGT